MNMQSMGCELASPDLSCEAQLWWLHNSGLLVSTYLLPAWERRDCRFPTSLQHFP